MKRFLWVILCLLFFSSCTTYHHVITEEDFGNAGAAALNCAVERYTLDSIESRIYFKSRANCLTANVYYSYPDCKVTDEMLVILFNYYNFAGTPQTEKHKEKLQSLLNE